MAARGPITLDEGHDRPIYGPDLKPDRKQMDRNLRHAETVARRAVAAKKPTTRRRRPNAR